MPQVFEVYSTDGKSSLRLRLHDRDYFVAELRGVRLAVEGRVVTYLAAGFSAMFVEMAADWRGWTGEKAWQSLEGELQLRAVTDGRGHVGLLAQLSEGAPPVWTVTLSLALEAGQLERLARDARAFDVSVFGAV